MRIPKKSRIPNRKTRDVDTSRSNNILIDADPKKDSGGHEMKLKGNHLSLVLPIAAQADTSSSQTP
jgi:hypothetical protein